MFPRSLKWPEKKGRDYYYQTLLATFTVPLLSVRHIVYTAPTRAHAVAIFAEIEIRGGGGGAYQHCAL